MGYSQTLPTGLASSSPAASSVNHITLTNAQANYGLGTLKTLNYKVPLSAAYATFVCDGAKDTSGAENHLVTTWLGYFQLDDTVSTKVCGLHGSWLYTPANGYSGRVAIQLNEDLVSYLNPDTTYTVTMESTGCLANNLIIYHPRLEITLYFGL